jgi:hypothetical protein
VERAECGSAASRAETQRKPSLQRLWALKCRDEVSGISLK